MTFAAWEVDLAQAAIDAHAAEKGAMLPILHALQEKFGCIPEAAVPLVAQALNLSRAEVHGVVSFYPDFRRSPPGRHVLKLCRAEACQAMGADTLSARARARLGIDWGETTSDGRLTLDPVFCLGLCATAPAAMMDDKLVGRLTETRLDQLLAEPG